MTLKKDGIQTRKRKSKKDKSPKIIDVTHLNKNSRIFSLSFLFIKLVCIFLGRTSPTISEAAACSSEHHQQSIKQLTSQFDYHHHHHQQQQQQQQSHYYQGHPTLFTKVKHESQPIFATNDNSWIGQTNFGV